MFHTSSYFQTQRCSSVSTWPQYHNQQDGELPQYTAKLIPYEIQCQEKEQSDVHKYTTIKKNNVSQRTARNSRRLTFQQKLYAQRQITS